MIGLAIGLPEFGKTQALMDYVNAAAHESRFCIVDRSGDMARKSPRWRELVWTDWGDDVRGGFAQLMAALRDKKKVNFWLEAPPPQKMSAGWLGQLPPTGVVHFGHPWEGDEVAELVKRVGNATLVDDEIDFTAEAAGWNRNPLREFCHRGRHLPNEAGVVGKVHILGAMRRPQNAHIDLTSLCDWAWIFRVQGDRTITRLMEDAMVHHTEVCEAPDDAECELPGRCVRHLEVAHCKLWTRKGSSWVELEPLSEEAAKFGK